MNVDTPSPNKEAEPSEALLRFAEMFVSARSDTPSRQAMSIRTLRNHMAAAHDNFQFYFKHDVPDDLAHLAQELFGKDAWVKKFEENDAEYKNGFRSYLAITHNHMDALEHALVVLSRRNLDDKTRLLFAVSDVTGLSPADLKNSINTLSNEVTLKTSVPEHAKALRNTVEAYMKKENASNVKIVINNNVVTLNHKAAMMLVEAAGTLPSDKYSPTCLPLEMLELLLTGSGKKAFFDADENVGVSCENHYTTESVDAVETQESKDNTKGYIEQEHIDLKKALSSSPNYNRVKEALDKMLDALKTVRRLPAYNHPREKLLDTAADLRLLLELEVPDMEKRLKNMSKAHLKAEFPAIDGMTEPELALTWIKKTIKALNPAAIDKELKDYNLHNNQSLSL